VEELASGELDLLGLVCLDLGLPASCLREAEQRRSELVDQHVGEQDSAGRERHHERQLALTPRGRHGSDAHDRQQVTLVLDHLGALGKDLPGASRR